ncbi:MAG: HDIG domain-containing protein [Bacteroidales bacterium]|nr:HDIG domain-containing protein [Candidatus Liminaster caballi]
MKNNKLSIQQLVIRVLFIVCAIALIDYVFPHNDSFRYEYELGKPWRYGRLIADYDFPVYHSDSVITRMEDSLQHLVSPIYLQDSEVETRVMLSLNKEHMVLGQDAYHHLEKALHEFYVAGILSAPDKRNLAESDYTEGRIRNGVNTQIVREASAFDGEKQVYDHLMSDTTYSSAYRHVSRLQDYIVPNLKLDSAAMAREYAERRKEISTTYRVIVAETRIIDQGQVIDMPTFDVLNSYKRAQQQRMAESNDGLLMHVGQILLISIILCSMLGFLFLFRKWHHERQSYTLVAVGMVSLMVLLTALSSRIVVGGAYLVPIGVTTIVLATFHGSRTAYWCHMVMALLCSFIAPSHFEYLVVQSVVGIMIIFCLNDGMNDRAQLLRVCLVAMIVYPLIYCSYTLANEGTLVNVPILTIIMMEISALLLMMSYLIIYALENLFGFMSGVTLVELCNLGQGLLLRLSKEAPGTFHHSLQVANLTAAAAEAIGAKSQLVRTGALYHDIGKLWNPLYFTENQMGGNPHDKLTTEESVEIIKRHVTEGLKMAEKANLPEDIRRFIASHHGRGFIKYFYVTWCNAHPGEEADKELFTYVGPDPETREEALLMMGDGIEAASKSLKDYSEESIRKLVNTIVDGLVADGRLNNARITLHEIQVVKESFIHGLESIYHSRIAYPELNKKS